VTCPVSGKRHSWEKLGLDVVFGRLRRSRRCSFCGSVKTLPYKAEIAADRKAREWFEGWKFDRDNGPTGV
jgi:hypothetical protein